MKTTALLAATAAALFIVTGCQSLATDDSGKAYSKTKHCYRELHKLPYRARVQCPGQTDVEKPDTAKPQQPDQPSPEKKP